MFFKTDRVEVDSSTLYFCLRFGRVNLLARDYQCICTASMVPIFPHVELQPGSGKMLFGI